MKNIFRFFFKYSYLMALYLFLGLLIFLSINEKERVKGNNITTPFLAYNSISHSVVELEPIKTFYGQMTAYGPDCRGCIGITRSGYDVRNGNIYYNDYKYGPLRIVAADRSIPLGTIIKINAPKLYSYSFLAIVLDRGGVIKGNVIDLLYEEEKGLHKTVGRHYNVRYDVLRKGW